jgi:hypothetical protein
MWKNMVEIAISFPQQQWLRGSATVLRVYVHCLPLFVRFVFSTIKTDYFPKNINFA